MRNFEALTNVDREQMLKDINLKSIEELYSHIPSSVRSNELNLRQPLSEFSLQEEIKKLAGKNKVDYISFLGGGVSKRFIPAGVAAISSRFEFNTAYTPYQPEISQGTLRVIYEYQSMICNITNMDVANASLYDAASACAEAVLTAVRVNGRSKCAVSDCINPQYLEVIKTYCDAADIEIDLIKCNGITTDPIELDSSYSCLLIQTPNFYGETEKLSDFLLKDEKTLLICCTDLFSLALLEPPICDIMVGDIQGLGNSLSFGGPYGGYFACKDKYKRQIPGRVAGRTVDAEGNQAFTLTLQTREQHIRREKATSNICSNQALIALQSAVYLTLTGKEGFKQAAFLSAKNAHLLAKKLQEKGIKVLNDSFFNEFTIKISNPDVFLAVLKENGILGGLKISSDEILICATEIHSVEDINKYVSLIP